MLTRLLPIFTILLMFATVASVFAYGASTFCVRYTGGPINHNSALAMSGNFLLDNGTMYVYAYVDSPDANSASYGTQDIFMSASDVGPLSNSGTASAGVTGYDQWGNYQSDYDSDSN